MLPEPVNLVYGPRGPGAAHGGAQRPEVMFVLGIAPLVSLEKTGMQKDRPMETVVKEIGI
jgi:hypothetical protein